MMDVRLTDLAGATTTVSTAGGRVAALLGAVAIGRADHATVVSGEGYRASIPLPMLESGGTLTVENGGLRLRVETGSTACWNVKDVVAIRLTVGRAEDDIPERPPH
jgi:hypothetical protein